MCHDDEYDEYDDYGHFDDELAEVKAELESLKQERKVGKQRRKLLGRWLDGREASLDSGLAERVAQVESDLRNLPGSAYLRGLIFNEVQAAIKIPPSGSRTILDLVQRVEALERMRIVEKPGEQGNPVAVHVHHVRRGEFSTGGVVPPPSGPIVG